MSKKISNAVWLAGAATFVTSLLNPGVAVALGAMLFEKLKEQIPKGIDQLPGSPEGLAEAVTIFRESLIEYLQCEMNISDKKEVETILGAVREVFLSCALRPGDLADAEFEAQTILADLAWDGVGLSLEHKQAAKNCARIILEHLHSQPDVYVELLPHLIPGFLKQIKALISSHTDLDVRVKELENILAKSIFQGDTYLLEFQRELAVRFEVETAVRPADCSNALSSLHVPLPVALEPSPAQSGGHDKDQHVFTMRDDKHGEQAENRFNTLADWLSHEETAAGAVLLGDPGSGKSTELRYLFCNIVYQTSTEGPESDSAPPGTLSKCQPLYLRLPDIATVLQKFDKNEDIDFLPVLEKVVLGYLNRDAKDSNPENLKRASRIANAYLSSPNRLLILLDGLDEVSGERGEHVDAGREQMMDDVSIRKRLQNWIKRCHGQRNLQGARWLVSARTYVYRDINLENFDFASLSAYNPTQKACYIKKHFALFNAPDKADNFLKFLKRPGISRFNQMLSRPLLLAYACELARDEVRGDLESLPTDRPGLLHETIDVLLRRWPEQTSHMASSFFENVRDQGKLQLFLSALEKLACAHLQTPLQDHGQAPDIPRKAILELMGELADQLSLSEGQQYTREQLVEYLERQSGLLIARSADNFAFVHLMLHEYLAACYFVNKTRNNSVQQHKSFYDLDAELQKKFESNPTQWREVLILSVGEYIRSDRRFEAEDLLELLIPLNIDERLGDTEICDFAENAVAALEEFGEQLRSVQRWPWRSTLEAKLSSLAFQSAEAPVKQRAIAGRIVAWLGDTRPGVGVREDGLPDIDWVDVEAPNTAYRLDTDDELVTDSAGSLKLDYAFRIGRYPITWQQYQCFVEDPDGHQNEEWWQGLEPGEDERKPEAAHWPIPNHPRDSVNWYECVAFCRWLTEQLRTRGELGKEQVIRLPSEWEWQYVATGGDAVAYRYPWGEQYQAGYANINETMNKSEPSYLARSTAVGLYPQGATKNSKATGLQDMSGNVWEWCINLDKQEELGNMSLSSDGSRALRGGSWLGWSGGASTAFRYWFHPGLRDGSIGFRVVCVPSHHRPAEH